MTTPPAPYTWTSNREFLAYFDYDLVFPVNNLDNPAQSINGSILYFYYYSSGDAITVSFTTSFSDDYNINNSILTFTLNPGDFFIAPYDPTIDPTAPPIPGEPYNVVFGSSSGFFKYGNYPVSNSPTYSGAADSNNSSGTYNNQTSTPTLSINSSGELVLYSGTFYDSIIKPLVK